MQRKSPSEFFFFSLPYFMLHDAGERSFASGFRRRLRFILGVDYLEPRLRGNVPSGQLRVTCSPLVSATNQLFLGWEGKCRCAFSGFIIALQSVVLTDIVGLEKLTAAFGLLLFIEGAAVFVGPPAAGRFISEQTNEWSSYRCFLFLWVGFVTDYHKGNYTVRFMRSD